MSEKGRKSSSPDIFQLLEEATEKEKERQREELLQPIGVEEFFVEGSITINKQTCQGIECKLCVDACPTNALYWKAGEIGILPELCIYCGACVLSCIVDDCIKIERKRSAGEVEAFSKPRDFLILQQCLSTKKRLERTQNKILKPEGYLTLYCWTI